MPSPSQKPHAYDAFPTYSKKLPWNFRNRASDNAKALFGLRLTLEETRSSTAIADVMKCRIQGHVLHPTSINLGTKKPEDFAMIHVVGCGWGTCGQKFFNLPTDPADRISLFNQYVEWKMRAQPRGVGGLKRLKEMAPKILNGEECRITEELLTNAIRNCAGQARLRRNPNSSPVRPNPSRDPRITRSSPDILPRKRKHDNDSSDNDSGDNAGLSSKQPAFRSTETAEVVGPDNSSPHLSDSEVEFVDPVPIRSSRRDIQNDGFKARQSAAFQSSRGSIQNAGLSTRQSTVSKLHSTNENTQSRYRAVVVISSDEEERLPDIHAAGTIKNAQRPLPKPFPLRQSPV
ncbi:hypothetical protein GYMLUDRAFT_100703 [Collybiopsis luxurians FD-317 M1]|uniref:Uncharacterized protein n=1 Tax=Collybiopsis luxurians FD-317 M1 TaxID=944289 RepID=A0A0D0CBV7_9AGAR|nr:hypothetical protein GYMLUDRAFT_100703 [Collybiopsis luxurians FD-317 M1]